MERLPQKKFFATVVQSENVAKGVKKISFTVNGDFVFLPQQFVWVEIEEASGIGCRSERNPFSLVNSPNTVNAVEILAQMSDSAFKQKLFSLKTGDVVNIHGPFGPSFALTETHHPENIILIAGGTGISAFLNLLDAMKRSEFPVRCYLVYLNAGAEVTPFIQELHTFMKHNTFFDYKIQFEKFSWNDVAEVVGGMKGAIEWRVVGSRPMVDHVYQTLESGGVSRSDVIFREFYPTTANNLTREAIQKLRLESDIFARASQQSSNLSIITDVNGIILFANKAAEAITGYTEEEILGNTPRLWGGMMDESFYKEFWQQTGSGKPFAREIINRRKNGDLYYTSVHISAIFGEEGEIIGYIGTEEDIASVKE